MPRTIRLAFVALALVALFFLASWVQFGIGVLVALTYWRTMLVPKEVRCDDKAFPFDELPSCLVPHPRLRYSRVCIVSLSD
jgi:hypothetical protein